MYCSRLVSCDYYDGFLKRKLPHSDDVWLGTALGMCNNYSLIYEFVVNLGLAKRR